MENPSSVRIKRAADFRDFLSLCLSHEVRFMVVGGYAVVHYSRPRYTGDLDIRIDAPEGIAIRVVTALHDFGLTGPDATTRMITGGKQIIRLGCEPMRLELFTRIPALEFDDGFSRRAARINGKASGNSTVVAGQHRHQEF